MPPEFPTSGPIERRLPRDGRLLFLTRFVRLFSYGMLGVVLVFYLTSLGLNESQTGLLLTLTLLGDTAVSLVLTTRADRIGRRRMLIAGAILMASAGLGFAFTRNFLLLIVAGAVGVISPSGNEVGPFLPIEQAALSGVVADRIRTSVFAWYTLTGAIASAAGSLFAGSATGLMERAGRAPLASERTVILLYAALGAVLALVFRQLSPKVEADSDDHTTTGAPTRVGARHALGIGASRGVVLRLSGLFALDAFGGGFVIQSFAAWWFYLRFGVAPVTLGGIFFGANLLAGLSALLATRIAERIGLVRTMVFTHLPSNVLLMLVPLMPNLRLATLVLLLRFSISRWMCPPGNRTSWPLSHPRNGPRRPALRAWREPPAPLSRRCSPVCCSRIPRLSTCRSWRPEC